MKTLQQAADKIARHLFKQKSRSYNGERCQYRVESDSGRLMNRCAVGCLIEKKYYGVGMEGSTAWADRVSYAIEKSGYDNSNHSLKFYREAQLIHDSDWNNRNTEFEKLCVRYGLQYNPQ